MVRGLVFFLFLVGCSQPKTVLVISKTVGYRHASIESGIKAVTSIATELDLKVVASEDTSLLCSEEYDVVVFLNTSGNILNEREQQSLHEFIYSGGGFLGIHSAADTEYDWSWYGETLLGAWFVSHPPVSEATIQVVDCTHPATKHLPTKWICTDEWYVYDRVPEHASVLLEVFDHPLSWCKKIGKGRSFYTGRGHTNESYAEDPFNAHIKGGIEWVLQ